MKRLFALTQTQWLLISAIVLFLLISGFSLVVYAYVSGISLSPLPGFNFGLAPTPATSPTGQSPSTIQGVVWHDLCPTELGEGGQDLQGIDRCARSAGGEGLANGKREADEPAIAGVMVRLGTGPCPAETQASAQSNPEGIYSFTHLQPGPYCVFIDALDASNHALLMPGSWSKPAPSGLVGHSSYTVVLQAGSLLSNLDFGWDYDVLTAPAAIETPVPTATPAPLACANQASFVSDISFPDNSHVKPGQAFEKVWRLRNTGSCTWDSGYRLVFVSGHSMQAASPMPLPGLVAPGSAVDLKVTLTAPVTHGTYRSSWMIMSPAGEQFGIGETSDKPFWVQIVVGPSGPTTTGTWRGEYFTNRDLRGTPALIKNDPVLEFNWGSSAPVAGIPANNFSVRWTGDFELIAATYRFDIKVDDGVRLWVDGQLLIDEWEAGSVRTVSGELGLAKGVHSIRLEFFEQTGDARVELDWSTVSTPSYPQWKGQYWDNRDLRGTPSLVRNDPSIDFNWIDKAPAVGLPADSFSIRWTRSLSFNPGTYRFYARSDDGLRLFIDGERVLNEWHESRGSTIYTVDRTLSGQHALAVEYFERGGNALVVVWWEKLSTATPTLTATPTATQTVAASTPTPTSTVMPDPSATPTATPTDPPAQEPQIVFDFTAELCSATWRIGSSILACPGNESDPGGFIRSVADALLETDEQARNLSVLLHPSGDGAGDPLQGFYRMFKVEAGDRLLFATGCAQDRITCDVTLRLMYWMESDASHVHTLIEWNEKYDGVLTAVDVDLAPLAEESVIFILEVSANGDDLDDYLLWITPRILR